MRLTPLTIPDVALLTPSRFEDNRGWFSEAWSERKLAALGFEQTFVQDNLSYSKEAQTLRGLHCQLAPAAQGKLVSVITGSIWDFAVDVREGSPTFGQSVKVELSENAAQQLWVPPGFLHGFITRAPNTRVFYKLTAPYNAQLDRSVAWNDPTFNIDWGVENPILSEKDANAPRLALSDVRFQSEMAS